MAKKGFVCTNCGNKKPKLTSALEYGSHRRGRREQQRQQYGEQRCVEGVSDMCNVCKGLRFFLNLDDDSDNGQQIQFVRKALEAPPPTKRGRERERNNNNMERSRKHSIADPSMPLVAKSPHHYYLMEPNKRSRSCVPRHSTNHHYKGRRSRSMTKKDHDWLKFIDHKSSTSQVIREVSPSSDYPGPVKPPRSSLMYNCRAIEGTKSSDSSDEAETTDNMLTEDPDDADTNNDYDDDGDDGYDDDDDDDEDDDNDEDDDDDHYRQKSGKDTEQSLEKLDESLLDSLPSSKKEKKPLSRNQPKLFQIYKNDDKPETSSSKKDDLEIKASDLVIEMSLAKKKELIGKLYAMKERLDKEYEKAKTELYELEYKCQKKNNREKGRKRERGGALISCPEMSNEEQTQDKVVSLDDQLFKIVKERHPYKNYSSLIPKPAETPICSSTTDSTVDIMYRQPSNSLRVLMSPKLKGFLKSSSRIITPNKRVPQICYAISFVQRAKYSGFITDPRTTIHPRMSNFKDFKNNKEPPMPQFSTIPCSRKELSALVETKPEIDFRACVARELLVSRAPIHCPDFDCKRLTFIADFNRHLLYDHRTLTIERISVKQPKTFFLDPNITLLNKAKCHMLYLVRDKVLDNHGKDLSELLPVLVMTTRVRMSEMYGFARALQESGFPPHSADTELFLIWLTSFIPTTSSVTGTISIWSTRKNQTISTLYVQTSAIYDVRAPQDMLTICHSTSSVVIPANVIRHMTNNGEDLLAVQIQVY